MAGEPEITGLDYIGRATYLEYVAAVAARGGLVVRLGAQAGQLKGVLGERYTAAVIAAQKLTAPMYWSTGNQWGYYVAPAKVRVLDKLHLVSDSIVIAEGKVAEVAEDLSKSLVTKIVTAVVVVGLVLIVVHIITLKMGASHGRV